MLMLPQMQNIGVIKILYTANMKKLLGIIVSRVANISFLSVSSVCQESCADEIT